MKVDIWKDLAEKISKRLDADDVIDHVSGEVIVSLKELTNIIEKEIKKFADERIARICFMVGEDEDTSKTG